MNIDEYLARKKEMETLLKKEGKGAIMGFIGNFMETNPEIKALRWNQYTPYFNDGDACVFSLGDVWYLNREPEKEDFEINPWDENGEPGTGWMDGGGSNKSPKALKQRFSAFANKLDKLGDMLESVFGDHIEVFVYRDKAGVLKTKVSEYDHD